MPLILVVKISEIYRQMRVQELDILRTHTRAQIVISPVVGGFEPDSTKMDIKMNNKLV